MTKYITTISYSSSAFVTCFICRN